MKYTTLVFDLDGTLLDTLDDIRDSVNHVLSAHGYPERSRQQIMSAVGNGSGYLMERSLPDGLDTAGFDAILEEYRTWYLEHNVIKTAPYEGVLDMLRELVKGEYKLAVVSNKPDVNTKKLVNHFFGGVISVAIGETSGVRRKPAPDTVNAALRQLFSMSYEAVYIGDSETDLETAANAGIPCISVSWGYRTSEMLRAAGAATIVDSPKEILRLV